MKEYIYLFYVIGINYLLIRLTLAELDSLELDLPAFEQRKNGGVNKNFLRGVVGPVDNGKEHPNFLNEDDYDLGQGYGEMDTGEDDDSGMGSFGANLEDYGSAYSHFDSGPEEGSRGEFQPFPDEMRSHFGQRAGQFVGKLKGMVNNGIRSRFPPVYPVNHDEDDSSLLEIPDSEGDGQDNSDDNENEGGDETPWYLADKNEPTEGDDGFTPFSLEDEVRDKRHATGTNGAMVVQEEVVESESDSEHEEREDEYGPPKQMDLSPLVDENGNEFQLSGDAVEDDLIDVADFEDDEEEEDDDEDIEADDMPPVDVRVGQRKY